MATGYHAAKTAHVKPGDKVVVVGDGAVGQCAVIAAKMLGASQIIIMSRHEDRQKMALESGATDVVAERGTEGIEKVIKLTGGYGADAVLECVGAQGSTDQAFGVVRPGGFIGRVGLPHGAKMDPAETFYRNVTLAGGPASVTTYDKEVLLKAVLDGQINRARSSRTAIRWMKSIRHTRTWLIERRSNPTSSWTRTGEAALGGLVF